MKNPPVHFKDPLTESEIEFRRMCDNSPILIWMSNTAGTGFFFNRAWRAFTGVDAIEGGDHWCGLLHPEDREPVCSRFKRHFASHTPYRVECRLRRRDGVHRWMLFHVSPYYDSHSQFAGLIGACFDFNEQHEFESALATRALKQTALAAYGRYVLEPHKFDDLAHEAVNVILQTLHVDCVSLASLDRDTLALSLEAFACRLGQKPPRDLGRVSPDALAITRAVQLADDPEKFPLAKWFAENGIRSSLLCPVGSGRQLYGFFFANTRDTRVFSPEAIDFIQGMANVLGTVYQRDRAEKALAESEQKLARSQKVETIGLLASGIAHDFNNLLAAIRGYTGLLQKDIDAIPSGAADDAARALRTHTAGIENAALRASRLVRQLLAFSRMQKAEIARIDINALVLGLKGLITAFLRSGIVLELQLGPAPVTACVDPGQIEQVILNLAINSRDAMPGGGRLAIKVEPARVTAETHPTLEPGDYAQISVTDTGTGIRPEEQAKLFTPFFTTKPKNRGTGLGLPTCANIVKNARGKITFKSEPGKGTTFTVLLPDFSPAQDSARTGDSASPFFPEPDDAQNAGAAPADDDEPRAPASAAPGPSAGGATIILVEDDPAIREVTGAILESLGHTVLAFETGERLLACYDEGSPPPPELAPARLLITDINMPGISGSKLAGRMRAFHPGALRVLFISGFITEAIRKSGTPVLEKPFTRDDLAQKVREALGD